MSKTVKKWLSILIPLLLGIFFIVYAYNQFTEEQIKDIFGHFKSADYFYIFISIVFGFIASVARSYRWKYTLEHLGYNIPFKNQFLAVNVSYLMNMFIPRSGEISRALVLKNYENVPFDKSFGTIIAERVIDLLILFLFMGLIFFLQFDIVKTFILDYIPQDKVAFIAITALFLSSLFFVIYRYSKLKFIIALKQKLSGLTDGILSVIKMKNKWQFLFYTILIWFSYVMMFYVAIFAFPETSTLSFTAVLTTFVVGSIAIAFTNNGLGSYPFLVAEILLFYGISATVGSAFGWIVWTSQTIFTIVLGLVSLFLLPILNKVRHRPVHK
ncbi:MAG: lysylphosphatidylglycerol synthase transmembrane domain-containing protein [Flavobacteriaceae bacterium]